MKKIVYINIPRTVTFIGKDALSVSTDDDGDSQMSFAREDRRTYTLEEEQFHTETLFR